MKDNLEKFVQEHRDEFDLYEPSERVWRSVDKQLKPKPTRLRRAYYPIAASTLLIVSASIWFMHRPAQQKVATEDTVVVIAPEIKEAERYYVSVVETKSTELNKFDKDYPELFKDFNGELDTLRLVYGQLETEYKNSDGNEAVLQALINNLQLQVQLLNKQIQIIQEIKYKEAHKKSKSSLI